MQWEDSRLTHFLSVFNQSVQEGRRETAFVPAFTGETQPGSALRRPRSAKSLFTNGHVGSTESVPFPVLWPRWSGLNPLKSKQAQCALGN